MDERDDFASYIRVMNVVRAIIRAMRYNARELEMRFGTSLAQLVVLMRLREGPASSLTELATRTMTHQTSVSVVVSRLVERGFVERIARADDRRTVSISITSAGLAFLEKAPPIIETELTSALAGLPAQDQVRLAGLLESLLERSGIPLASSFSAEATEQAS